MSERPIQRALISVSDKNDIVAFARQLSEMGIVILSTGGTSALLREHRIATQDVAHITGFPEIMDGRVKTLHPHIHGGILGKRNAHADVAKQHAIEWIDLVVVNLYPFAQIIQQPDCNIEQAIENIDIGGPALIRSAAKNMTDVSVVVDPADYSSILEQIRAQGRPTLAQRRLLAQKAFQYTAEYDQRIYHYLSKLEENTSPFPPHKRLSLNKITDLRYGENPTQQACAYRMDNNTSSLLDAPKHQGKALSYNNIVDADAALACVLQFNEPACVIVKHANPCGVACGNTIEQAFAKAFTADSTSAFGGIVALNQPCDAALAAQLTDAFLELVLAPGFSLEALETFKRKPNLRVLDTTALSTPSDLHYQYVTGLFLAQDIDNQPINRNALRVVTKAIPSAEEIENALFAWKVVKYVKSNAIVISKSGQTLGIGTGQVSRIDAVEIAIRKAGSHLQQAALASDAFFPFQDTIEAIARTGVKTIIQPGGSIRDNEVIKACDAYDIGMIFTDVRVFRH